MRPHPLERRLSREPVDGIALPDLELHRVEPRGRAHEMLRIKGSGQCLEWLQAVQIAGVPEPEEMIDEGDG